MFAKQQELGARSLAYLALRQIEKDGAYANIALKQVLNQHHHQPREARLAAELVYGTTRMRLAVDHIMRQFLNKPLSELMPELKIILRMSIYQLHYLKVEPYAAVNEGVSLTKKYASPRLAGLTNAVLRNYLRADKQQLLPAKEENFLEYLHLTLSFPQWLVDYLLQHYSPAEAEAFCLHANAHHGIAIRTNTLKISRDELLELLASEGITAHAAGYAPETIIISGGVGNIAELALFREGYFIVQGLSSQLVGHALSPRPGSMVLDLCAAPGGKSTHLAALMNNQGAIDAFDIHPHKVELIKDNAQRLGIQCFTAHVADSRRLPERYQQVADYVLLDAPCSGLGVLAARSDSRFRKEIANIDALAKLSYQLLEAAATYVKPGGKLCYSTCTITNEENVSNIRRFLAEHNDFALAPLQGLMPLMTEKREQLGSGEIQLMPFAADKELEGFYIALLEKRR